MDLLVLVKSRVESHERRRIIRETWGLESEIDGGDEGRGRRGGEGARGGDGINSKRMEVLFVMGLSESGKSNPALIRENYIFQVN